MRLTRIQIEHLRGIKDLTIDLHDFTSLIGPNNSCKSTVLRAINLILSTTKPDPEEWHKSDFTKPVCIQAWFDGIEEWERTTPGISGLVYNDKIHLRYTAPPPDSEKKSTTRGRETVIYEAMLPSETITGWGDKWGDISDEIKAVAKAANIDGTMFKSVANKEKVKQCIRAQLPGLVTVGSPRFTDEGISINQALQQALPQAIIIPAVCDAADEVKPGAKTAFGQLLTKILLPAVAGTDEYRSLDTAVKRLQDRLSQIDGAEPLAEAETVALGIKDRLSSLIDASVKITLDAPDIEKLLTSSFGLRLNDGTDTPVHLQGHGLQRALIYSLIELLADQTAQLADKEIEELPLAARRSTILLFEEPELFVHPHLMRRLRDRLQTVASSSGWQVVMTTHSPFLVNVANDPRSLVIFQRTSPAEPPVVQQLQSDPFLGDSEREGERMALRAAIDFHPTVCEAFFAKKTVLVEGDTEVAVLRHHPDLYSRCELPSDASADTTIVSCGGKWTIIAMARMLNLLKIPFRVIHDQDKKGREEGELINVTKIDPYAANTKIAELVSSKDLYVCNDTIEHLLWEDQASVSSKDKPFRA